jgi:hypothetical protein
MENSHLKSKQQNPREVSGCPAMPDTQEKSKTGSTLQRKVYAKREVLLDREEFKVLAMVFDDYGIKKPGWLRQQFFVNQRRRKQLSDILADVGCDGYACNTRGVSDGWARSLHVVWHSINERLLCRAIR